jgi:uncharacterized protein involved in cysteine biosynthesis
MPAAFILAFAQLWDAQVRAVLWRALLLTLLLFAGLAWGIFTLVDRIEPAGWPAWAVTLWSAGGEEAAAVVLSALLTWLGFTSIATAVMAIWQDEIIMAAIRVALINALLLPAYLLLLFTGVGPLILFVIANGWALGREYLEAVAARHVAIGESRAWPGQHKWDSWGIGILTAGLFAVPFVNLVAPMMGAMMATHIFHREREDERKDQIRANQRGPG